MEQWEINLRNQLSGKKEKKESVVYSQNFAMPENKNNILVFGLIILGFAILFTMDYKTGLITNLFKKGTSSVSVQKDAVEEDQQEIEPVNTNELENLKVDLEKLQSKVKFNNERIILMGMLLNENFSILKLDKDKDDFIFFDRKWKLKGWPQNVILTESDKEWLKSYIVEKNQ
jgi:hypothetical protein